MAAKETRASARTALLPFILIVALFFFWGVANNLNDILIAQFKKTFSLTDLQSGFVQSAFYLGYFLFAIPASLFMRRFGYKAAVFLGLLLYGLGALLFYPAAQVREYQFFLGALFVIASGLAFLETSANPFVAVLGSPETSERRLNFAQAFNSLGAIAGVQIGRHFILSGVEHTPKELAAMPPGEAARFFATEGHAVQGPYLVVAAVVLFWALLVLIVKFPPIAGRSADEDAGTSEQQGFTRLFRHRHYLFGVVAQFFYVGAQAGIWSYMIRYGRDAAPGMPETLAADYLTWSIVGFMIGRFAGTALMGTIKPERLMAIFAAVGVALTLVAALVGGQIGLYALAATSFFMSIMFPTIFASSIRGLGPLTKSGSSFLIMSIIGGAVLTPLMGRVSDLAGIRFAILVPAVCFAVIFTFASSSRRGATRA